MHRRDGGPILCGNRRSRLHARWLTGRCGPPQ
jgi:hypothetical protein